MGDAGGHPEDHDDGHLGRSLALASALAAVAGFVDAVGYLRLFGAFPANQSGNAVLLGMATAEASVPPAWVSATAIGGFVAGTAGAAWLARRLPSRSRRSIVLAVELGLVVLLAVAVGATGTGDPLLGGWGRFALLLLAAVAMGVQTEVIRRAAGVTLATTYQSGAIARIGESAAGLPGAPRRAETNRALVVLCVVVAAYVAGAALGASPLGEGRTALVAPCLALAVLLVVSMTTSPDDDG